MNALAVRTALTVAVLGLAAAGCGATPDRGAQGTPTSAAAPAATTGSPSAAPSQSRRPLSAVGGQCKLLSYELVSQTTQVDFDTAAGTRNACALQVYGHPYPSLTLAVSTTKAGPKTFQKAVPPAGATAVAGLGRAAYRVVQKASARSGPSAEVGWLLDGKIYILRYTFERGVSSGQAGQMARGLVALAKQINVPD